MRSDQPDIFRILIRILVVLTAILVGGWLVSLFDKPVWDALRDTQYRPKDHFSVFRVMGFLPLWLMLSLALVLIHTGWKRVGSFRQKFGPGLLLALSTILAGGVGEVLKLLIRRERPGDHDGAYVFRSIYENTFSTGGLGLPSSHAIIAFAAMWTLIFLYPRATVVWLFIGFGCAAQRVIEKSHFISDTYLSCVAALIVTWWLYRALGRPRVPGT